MTVRDVRTDLTAYRAAVAELAPRTRLGDGAAAISVIDGQGAWWDRLVGAVGYVVDEPEPAPAGVHARLREIDVPIVVVRRRLRPDVVGDAVAGLRAATLVVVDAWSGRANAAAFLRDAVGWARVLVGTPLEIVARADTGEAAMVALMGAGGCGASVTRTRGGGMGGVLTATALGPVRVTIRVDSASPVAEVVVDDEGGRFTRPARRESAERLALRRVLDAIERGAQTADLGALAEDDALASLA